MTKTYLGDGAYAEIDRGMIKLTADGNAIYLEPEVFGSFVTFAIKNRWVTNSQALVRMIDLHNPNVGEDKPRDLRKCHCNDCGSSYEVMYDVANDYYICRECLDKEEEDTDDDEEDDEEE